jgi:PAS domain S-box-containing protein
VQDDPFLLPRQAGAAQEARCFTWSLRRVRLPGDEGWGILGTAWETTERRAAEAAAKESAERLGLALESADAGTWEWDLRTNANTWSDGMWRLHGLAPEGRQASYDLWRAVILEADCDRAVRAVQNAAKLGVDIHLQYRVRAPDGSDRWIASLARAVRDESSRPIRYVGIALDVTARHLAEEAQRAVEREKLAQEGEARVRALVGNMRDAVFTVDLAGRITLWAGAAERMFGFTEMEALGRRPEDLLQAEAPLGDLESYRNRLAAGERTRIWLRFRPWHGETIDADVVVEPLLEGGKVTSFLGVARDITALKDAERELKASEEQLSLVLSGSADGFWDWRPGEHRVSCSARMNEILGRPPVAKDLPDDEWSTWVHPDDRDRARSETEGMFAGTQERGESEFRVRTEDGTWKWVRSRGRVAARDASGRPTRIAGTLSDVHLRREAEEERARSEAKYRGLYESIADGFVLVDPGGPILEFNETYRRMLGYEAAELRRMTYPELTPEAWHAFEARIVEEQILPRGYSDVYEKEYRRKDGSVFPVELRTFALRDPERGLTFWAIVRDITERKRARDALRASEARFHAMADLAPIGIYQSDAAGQNVYLNAAGQEIVGMSLEKALGGGWRDAVHPADRERVAREWTEAVRAGKSFRSEYRYQKPSGAITWARSFASPIEDEAGILTGHIGVIVDVTEERALQAQIGVGSRLAAMGTLVGGIAHEINNPLAGTLANEGFALEELREIRGSLRRGEPLRPEAVVDQLDEIVDALEGAQTGAQRVAKIVRDLVTLSRPEEKRGRVSLSEVAEHAMRWVSEGPATASVKVERAEAPDVLAAAGQLEQVVATLVANAALASVPGRPGRITVRIGAGEAGGARIEVEDDGEGMTPEVLARVFDPFFTTRPVGSGMGLGLSVAHAIVTAHGGTITVQSAPGKGSTFRVELPALVEAPAAH